MSSSSHNSPSHNFPPLKNDRLLKAIRFEKVDTTPVWIMRQAGRYLPEYKQTRSQAGDFLSLCKDVDKATEVTLQPFRRFDLDCAILFSDILTVPDALGLGLYFEAGDGPKFKKTVRNLTDVEALPNVNIATELDYVMKAVTNIRHALNGIAPLFGFSGSAWTLATYMVEGGGSKEFRHIKAMMYREPETLHLLLDKLANVVIDYLVAQIDAGAQLVQVFDSWGGVLAYREFMTFSHQYNQKVVQGVKAKYPDIPVVVFTKGGGLWLSTQVQNGADMLGLDWTMSLADARKIALAPTKPIALQGNLDPAVLYASCENIYKHTHLMLNDVYSIGQKTGYVANLGHGIQQWVDPDCAKAFIDAVHDFSL
ncbi:uroporphyrinogen decarboxylase [Moraxella macacae]|nr:uroporphyrinogen decarboxylase [Moraxella macacae]